MGFREVKEPAKVTQLIHGKARVQAQVQPPFGKTILPSIVHEVFLDHPTEAFPCEATSVLQNRKGPPAAFL